MLFRSRHYVLSYYVLFVCEQIERSEMEESSWSCLALELASQVSLGTTAFPRTHVGSTLVHFRFTTNLMRQSISNPCPSRSVRRSLHPPRLLPRKHIISSSFVQARTCGSNKNKKELCLEQSEFHHYISQSIRPPWCLLRVVGNVR